MADKGFLIDDILPDGNNIEDDMSRIYFNLSVNCDEICDQPDGYDEDTSIRSFIQQLEMSGKFIR